MYICVCMYITYISYIYKHKNEAQNKLWQRW